MGRGPRYQNRIDGLLLVDKPLGMSSAGVTTVVRFAAGNCKTGHAGTLDPLASGLVICCLGQATKTVSALMGATKIYETEVDFSAFTTTDDREGEREEILVSESPTTEQVRAACVTQVGEILQVPPIYSAIHVGGQRAYRLARGGETPELAPRQVRIDAIELLDYRWPVARLRITCGKGTYIRAIARDLGKVLGTGGHLASLRRTRIGDYDVAEAWSIEQVKGGVGQADLLPLPDEAGAGAWG